MAKIALPFDFGFLFMLGWPILWPFYIGKLHPAGRWMLIAKMYFFAVAPVVVSVVVSVVAAVFG